MNIFVPTPSGVALGCRVCKVAAATRYLPGARRKTNYCDNCQPTSTDSARRLVRYPVAPTQPATFAKRTGRKTDIEERLSALEAGSSRCGKYDERAVDALLKVLSSDTTGGALAHARELVRMTIQLSEEVRSLRAEKKQGASRLADLARESTVAAMALRDKKDKLAAEVEELVSRIADGARRYRQLEADSSKTVSALGRTEEQRDGLIAELANVTKERDEAAANLARVESAVPDGRDRRLLSRAIDVIVPARHVVPVTVSGPVDFDFPDLSSGDRSKVVHAIQEYLSGKRTVHRIRAVDAQGRERFGLHAGRLLIVLLPSDSGWVIDSLPFADSFDSSFVRKT